MVILGQDIFGGKGTAGVFAMQIDSSLIKKRGDMERAHLTDHLIGTNQKIPNWLIKIILLRKVETATEAGSTSLVAWTLFI